MSLYQSIVDAQLQARKEQNKQRLSTLQLLISDIQNERKSAGKDLTDEQVAQVVTHQVKRLKDSIIDFEKGGRQDLVDSTSAEVVILSEFLPEQLSDEVLEQAVKDVIEEMKPAGPGDMGKVMGKVMSGVKGKADGNRVRELVTKFLS